MDRLVNTALTAMRAAMSRQSTIANNLANTNTVGFRAEIANATTRWIDGQTFKTRAQTSEQVLGADMKEGSVTSTGNPLDVAINGEALLAVQANDGSEAYTRRGDLKMSDSGLLTTGDGLPVIGNSGPITMPPYDQISISRDGAIWIVPQGGDPKQPQQVDQLKLATPAGSQIQRAGWPVPRSEWRRAAQRSAGHSHRRFARRVERQCDGNARSDDRGQPRMGNAGEDDRYRQADRRWRCEPDETGQVTGPAPDTPARGHEIILGD